MSVLHSLLHRRAGRLVTSPVREAVVLSGGGSLGAAQVGALRALLEAGIRPDLVVGCSVGALNGAFFAVDPTLDRVRELDRVWRTLASRDVFGSAGLAGQLVKLAFRRGDHLCDPHALRELVRRWVPLEDLAQTGIPCHVVTTDLRTGQPCWWSTGDPVAVLTASACLPGVFPPVALLGGLHVDGGVTRPVPVERALDLGAARTWVLDVSGVGQRMPGEPRHALDVLLRSFAISRSHLSGAPTVRPEQRVVPLGSVDVGPVDLRDFRHTERLLDAGYAAGCVAVAAEEARLVPAPRRSA